MTEPADPDAYLPPPLDDSRATKADRRVHLAAAVAALALVGSAALALPPLLEGIAAGPQPSSVVPGSAYSYVSIDVSPSLGQKAAAVSFLAKLPSWNRQQLTAETDFRKAVFERLNSASGSHLVGYNFDTDISPWLGDRFAVMSVRGMGGRSVTGFVLAVTDESAAQAMMHRVSAAGGGTECQVANSFAVCTEEGQIAQAMATDKANSLAANKSFVDELAAVPGDAVGTVWVDLAVAATVQPADNPLPAAASLIGRLAGKIRFDGAGAIEFVGLSRDGTGASAPRVAPGTQIGLLPPHTVVAISANGLGRQLTTSWPRLLPSWRNGYAREVQADAGLALPDDLGGLLGDHSTFALGGLNGVLHGDEQPSVALITDGDASVADGLAAKHPDAVWVGGGAGSVVLASSADYGRSVTAGGLGDLPAFRNAVPNATTADGVAYIDVARLAQASQGQDTQDSQDSQGSTELITPGDAAALQSLGLSWSNKDGVSAILIRLTSK